MRVGWRFCFSNISTKPLLPNRKNLMEDLKTEITALKQRVLDIELLWHENGTQFAELISSYRNQFDQLINTTREKAKIPDSVEVLLNDFSKLIEINKEIVLKKSSELNGISDEINQSSKRITLIESKSNEQLVKITEIASELDEARNSADDANDISAKVNAIFKSISSRKNEIDEIYYELDGQDKEDESGQKVHIDGLSDLLESSYKKLAEKINNLSVAVDVQKHDVQIDLNEIVESTNLKFKDFINVSTLEKDKVVLKLKELLPNAMTAGLSSAYNKKRRLEEKESVRQKVVFKYSIIAMTAFALIPVLINAYYFYEKDVNADILFKNFPYLLSIIFPIYIPVLWIANSANKNINLSKRLVEEYSHKEVLAKTFEGLSHQISEISASSPDIATELRIKLLYNLLEVSSENPGKLISDYKKGDHPLMDALEKSSQLTDAFKKLVDLPGFSSLAKRFADKADAILAEQGKKADAGFDLNEASTGGSTSRTERPKA